MDKAKFDQALEQEACDVVDTMLSQGYIPDRNSINTVCINGNLTLLQTLLHSGKYDMDVQGGLIDAICLSHTHLLNHLYLAGANVNLPDNRGNTSLHRVMDLETCKWLLDMGAQQVLGHFGKTPLHRACARGYVEVARQLLSQDQGIQSISMCDNLGNTPLHFACQYKRVEVVKLLLSYEQGVRTINQPNMFDETPLDQATLYSEIVALLQNSLK